MASPTPGVLSKLLQNAAANVTSSSPPSSSHRSPLLQVIEIVPCLADDQWRSEGFFVKVSDSLHAAYVAVCAGEDADLIRSDDIQLGQLVYVRGGLQFERGCPVPVIRGLKPVPKRRPCFGNPSDLVSSDVLIPFTQGSPMDDTKKKAKKKNGVETPRLSLDSVRKGWDQTPPPPLRRDAALLSSPRFRNKLVLSDKKASPKIESQSPSRHLSSDTSALKGRNVITPPKFVDRTPKDGIRSPSKAVVPVALFKMPLSPKTWSDRRILWSGLPSTIQMLGKEISSHKNVAFSAAVSALEEASAAESLLKCLRAFGELCESSQKLSTGQLMHHFFDLYRIMQSTAKTVHSLFNSRSTDAISSKHSGSHNHNINLCTSTAEKNAASWVQAAVVSDIAQFSLFKEPGKLEAAAEQEYHHIVIENSSGKRNPENPSQGSMKSPRNPANKGVLSPLMKHCSAANRKNVDRKSRLRESASLAEKLLLESRRWFLKYLENSLNKGFFSIKTEGAIGNASLLLIQLKKLNSWLDDLIVNRLETKKEIEDIRKKLQRFLLEHIEASIAQTRPYS